MSDPTQNPPSSPPPPPEQGGYTPEPAAQPAPPTAPGTTPPAQGAPPPPQQGWAPPPPAPTPQPSGVGQPADLLMRFLARLIDFVLLAVVNGILVTAIVVGSIMNTSAGIYGTGSSWAANAVSALLTTLIALGYFVLMESRAGQTVGKMLLKLRTEGPDGKPPTTEQALRRNAWIGLGLLGVVPFLGILGSIAELVAVIMIAVTINNSATRQGWHDNFAGGTRVIKIG